MKKFNFINMILLAVLVVFSFSAVKAQNEMPPTDAPNAKNINKRSMSLLSELNLTPDQIAQIRRINAEKKPPLRAAQQQLRQANRNLDEAIYADNVSETDIQLRVKEVQAAQIEVIKLRSLTELAVRRILTAEQLARFREIRRQFMEKTDEQRLDKRGNRPANFPSRRFNKQQRQINLNN